MFCPNCGVELSSEGCFCAKCGKNVAYLTQQKDEDADVGVAAELQEPTGAAASQEQDVPSDKPEEAAPQATEDAPEEAPDAAESPEAVAEATSDANAADAAAQNEPLVAKTGQPEKDKDACDSVIKVPKGKIYYCNECGTAVFDQDNYCYYCGKKTNKKYYHHSRFPINLSAKWLWGGVGVVAFLAVAFFSYKLTK